MKSRIINEIIRVEGGYVNDPSDSGGETKYGITAAVARQYGYPGHMAHMPVELAFKIYAEKYWDAVRADDIAALSEPIAEEIVDTCVNMGPQRAGTFLQRALNALNNQGQIYADLQIDGDIGLKTIAALRNYLSRRNAETLAKALNCLQGAFYIELTERREKDERFLYGWLKNRVNL